MQCPKCKHENPTEAIFCMKCGAKLETRCPNCGAEYPEEALFCMKCGTKLKDESEVNIPKLEDMQDRLYIPEPLRRQMDSAEQELQGENRLVSALFADISGFTSLSNQHSPENVVNIVNDCFKVIVDTIFRYEGNPNRFIGDNVLAFFGAPITHENDSERAIMAALEMRDKVRELSLDISIGINTGMMYFGPIGTREHLEVSAYGPDINLAKRFQEIAQPGQILVGSGTYKFTRKTFDFINIPALFVKGYDKSVTAYEALRIKTHPEKLRGIEGLRARMIGREHEFTELKEATDEWLTGHGQIVSVIGEAGIGKSRLVGELIKDLRLKIKDSGDSNTQSSILNLQSLIVLEGRCVSIGQPVSYWPFIDILHTYFGLSERDDSAVIADKVTEATSRLFPQNADEVLPFLGNLLSIKFGNELDEKLKSATPDQIRHQTMMRLRDFFEALARKQPLLMIMEDLHWADEFSLDLIALLMDSLPTIPLMLFCVYRPEQGHRVWQLGNQAQRKCLDRYTEITLRKLSSHESRELVESLLEIDNLPEKVKEMILQKSEGNPFFIEEVIRSLIDQGLVYHEGDRWKASPEASNIDVPDTIQGVILARVDKLKAEARYVLQCASVIGRLFKYNLLDHLTQHERNLQSYLDEFERRELVYEERIMPELEYAFKHVLTQEATYQNILERRRKEFHHEVAQGIEQLYRERLEEFYEELAHHYSKSEDDKKAVEYLLKAGEKAIKSYANEVAIQYFNEALLRLPESGNERTAWELSAMESLGHIYSLLGRHDEAISHFQSALAIRKKRGDTPQEQTRLHCSIAESLFWQERSAEAIQIVKEGLDLLGDKVCVEQALLCKSLSYMLGRYTELLKGFQRREEAEFYTRRCWELTQQLFAKEGYFPDLPALWSVVSFRSPLWTDEQKIAHYEEGIKLCQQHGNKLRITEFAHNIGDIYLWVLGDPEQSVSWFQCSIDNSRETGEQNTLMYSLIDIGVPLIYAGESWQKAGQYLQEGLGLAEIIGKREYVAVAKIYLGIVYANKQNWLRILEVLPSLAEELVCTDMPFGSMSKLIFSHCLMLLEKAWTKIGSPEAFPDFCGELKKQYPEYWQHIPLNHLQPEPIQSSAEFEQIHWETPNFEDFKSNWEWQDESGRSSIEISPQSGEIKVCAPRACILWPGVNMRAPRLLRPIEGDFVIETWISSIGDKLKSGGGILIWKDEESFLYVAQEGGMINFQGNINGKWYLFGRGFWESDKTLLRLERFRDRVCIYFSSNNQNWFSLGEAILPVKDPVNIGLFAASWHGYPLFFFDTAIQFDNIRIGRRIL